MARFKGSPIVGAISGPIGGVEFAQGKTSANVKVRRRHARTQSFRQVLATHVTTVLMQHYDSASDLVKAAWSTFAKQYPRKNALGQTVNWTGKQAAVMYYTLLFDWFDRQDPGPWVMTAPPPYSAIAKLILSLTLSFTQGGPYTVTAVAPWGAVTRQMVHAARLGNGAKGGATNFRFIGSQTFNGNAIDWYSKFTSDFNCWDLRAGEVVKIQVRHMGYQSIGWPNYPWVAQTTVLAP